MKKWLPFILLFAAPAAASITGMRTLPGGSSTYIQYNAGGNFAGDADATFNGTTITVTGLSVTTLNATTLSASNLSATYGVSATTGVFSGALSAATLDTGQGANELYDMDQNVQTTDGPTFATVNTGQGANELYDMNQNVQTGDSVTFGGITNSALTSGRVVTAGASGVLQDDADFTFNGATATITGASHTSLAVSGLTTLASSLTGVLRGDSGAVSVDSDVTDIVAAASDSAAGKIELAIQSEQETGTDVARAVTPGRQQYHASASKAWASVTNSGTPSLAANYNISGIVDSGVGDVTLTINTDFSGTTYAVVCTMATIGDGSSARVVGWATKAAGSVHIRTQVLDADAILASDDRDFDCVLMGDQ